MRQHKAICAVGGFKVVGSAVGGGGWCDRTGSWMAGGADAKKPHQERQSDQILNFRKTASCCDRVAVLRLEEEKEKKKGGTKSSKNK